MTSLPDSISRLTALQILDLHGNSDVALPPGLTACRQLTRLDMGNDNASPVLSRLRGLRRLSFRCLQDQRPHSTYWTHLTALTELTLDYLDSCSVPEGLGGLACLQRLGIFGAALRDLPGIETIVCERSGTAMRLPVCGVICSGG